MSHVKDPGGLGLAATTVKTITASTRIVVFYASPSPLLSTNIAFDCAGSTTEAHQSRQDLVPRTNTSTSPSTPNAPSQPTAMGSVVLPHLSSGWHVDQAIMSEEDRLVVIRFGRDWDKDCMRQDEVLYRIADRVKNFAVVYVCDLDQVPDFNQMYELYDPMTIMFFFRNKHMMCDFGTGNNNKLNWVLEDKQELIDIIETIYRGAKKGRGLVVSPKDYSTRYRY
ncbi:mitosis protein dim1 [Aureobasidium sp. EXF-10727]|nr:mitosis protein dim1 [Aureobasidium sp. EXF-10727]KAI4725003.1 mitosis protein dim1 [Aureobasidium sp. EXF-10728]